MDNFLYQGHWYVQPHNSFIGQYYMISVLLLEFIYVYFLLNLKKNIRNTNYNYILGVFIFFNFSYELFVFQYP